MFSKNISSFFDSDGQIRFTRVLISLLSLQIVLFILGSLLYLSFTTFSSDFEFFVGFFYVDILKNGILVSTFSYIILAYFFVNKYNKSSIHSFKIKSATKIVLFSFVFLIYSIYMLIDSGFFILTKDAPPIKEHYYFYIIFLMSIVNISVCIFIITLFSLELDSSVNTRELIRIRRGVINALKVIFTSLIFYAFFFLFVKNLANDHDFFSYYIKIFFTLCMIVIFIGVLIYCLSKVCSIIEKAIESIDSEYIQNIKINISLVEMFENIIFDDLTISRITLNSPSARYVAEEIKKKGNYEEFFLVRFCHEDKIYSAYFDKKGNLLAENERTKE